MSATVSLSLFAGSCEICGESFAPRKGGRPQRFCSALCRRIARKDREPTIPEKVCRDCGIVKASSDFYRHEASADGLWPNCKECLRAIRRLKAKENPDANKVTMKERYWRDPEASRQKSKEYRQKNLERLRAYDRERRERVREKNVLQKYGITQEDFDRMMARQSGVCAICGRLNRDGRPLAVDHDHATEAVRGLLCDPCNLTLGYMQDRSDWLTRAAEYVTNPPGVPS